MQKTAIERERERESARQSKKNAKLLHQISQMRPNTQKQLKGRASQAAQKGNISLADASLCGGQKV